MKVRVATKVNKKTKPRPAAAAAAAESSNTETNASKIKALEVRINRLEEMLRDQKNQDEGVEELRERLDEAERRLTMQQDATYAATRWCKSTTSKVRRIGRYFLFLNGRVEEIEQLANEHYLDAALDGPYESAEHDTHPVDEDTDDIESYSTSRQEKDSSDDDKQAPSVGAGREGDDLRTAAPALNPPSTQVALAIPPATDVDQESATSEISPALVESEQADQHDTVDVMEIDAPVSNERSSGAAAAAPPDNDAASATVNPPIVHDIPILQLTVPTPQSSMEQVVADSLFPPVTALPGGGPRRSPRSRSNTPGNDQRYTTRGSAARSIETGNATSSKRKAGNQDGPSRKKSREPHN